ncbi:MAG: peptide chain release factor N(5)-glutamine methyltransferase [Helicobacteraceae bacterium]|nr:peptide chain release factor N(5)-glutamine methyltransferase [Helicobacteraceae bacterium]
MNINSWLNFITKELSGLIENPRREAELIVMHYLNRDQLWLIGNSAYEIEDDKKLYEWIQRRSKNEPLEYITNSVSFYSQNFFIKEGALIPRPETEILIDEVCKYIESSFSGLIVEVGVGSGIISILLAQKLPLAKIIAVDISEEALEVAKQNIANFGFSDRIELRKGSLLSVVDEKVDVLVSNPPYIANEAPLESNLSYEPSLALFGGNIGDEIVNELLNIALDRNIKYFFCEFGYDQKDKVSQYLKNYEYKELTFYKDWSNFDRGFTLRL